MTMNGLTGVARHTTDGVIIHDLIWTTLQQRAIK